MSKKDLEKSRKKKKEGFSAYEIYQKTHVLLWPVLFWSGEDLEVSQDISKKSLLLKTLKNKQLGLYCFTPGDTEKIEVYPLSGTVLSSSKLCLGYLKKVSKDFSKKFQESEEWYAKINSRLRFLKIILSNYESFLKKKYNCLALEEQIYFASSDSKRPSHWLTTEDIKKYNFKKFDTLKKVILTKRQEKVSWEGQWEEFIKKHQSFPPELIVKLYQSKKFNPYTLKSICSFDEKLILSLLEEMKLNGELFPDSINQLPFLFSELQKFLHEPEIRACLCRDLVHTIFKDESLCLPHFKGFLLNFEEVNSFVTEYLAKHLSTQGVSYSRSRSTIFDAIHWYTGVSLKKAKKDIYIPSSYYSGKIRDAYEERFLDMCLKLMKGLVKGDFFEITCLYLKMLKKGNDPALLLKIIEVCREFCPPGENGDNALKLATLILKNSEEHPKQFIEWISHNLHQLLVHAHNKTMDEQFHSPEYERTEKMLVELLKIAPLLYESKISDSFLSDSNLLYTLVYISPKPKCLEWIIQQDEEWINSAVTNRYGWDYIFGMPEPFSLKILAWGTKLRQSELNWQEISDILYSIEDFRTDSNESEILKNLNLFKKVFLFSKKINDLIKKKYKVKTVNCFEDICGFFEYVDKIKNGWSNIDILWDLFFEFIETYITENTGEDYSLYQGYYKINWIACFDVQPERTVEILKSLPMYHNSFFEKTLQPLHWLSKNHKPVFEFINFALKDRDSFNRLIHILKMLKVSFRLNQTKLSKSLDLWSDCEVKDDLEQLKFYRKLAKFDTDLPRNVRKIIELPDKLKKEQESLASLKEKGKISESALIRLNKVREWLQNKKRLQKNIFEDLSKVIPEAVANAKMDSLLEISEQLCKEHWRSFSNRPVDSWNDDWRNALQLSFMTDKNKRILRKLMLNAAGNDFQWIYYHPKNVKFLNELPVSFNQSFWISPLTLTFKVGSKSYTVEAEKNLLKILQMGNYFGSCLSVGDMNDFSTIANAVEINKHVLWIKNSKGKIVGRKLIVLNQLGELYGFNSYGAALGSDTENPWFKIIFDLYCLKLMELCNGKLCNKRKEEDLIILFSKWYDDGIERFDGWIMDLQRKRRLSYISKKVKFKTKGVNLRAALWLNSQGEDILVDWDGVKKFKTFNTKNFEVIQKSK